VAVTPVEPAFAELPALKLKFTVFAERVRVNDSVNLAFKAIVWAPELSWADAMEAGSVIAKPTIAAQKILPVFIIPPNGVLTTFLADRDGPADADIPKRQGECWPSRNLRGLCELPNIPQIQLG
jgi:hypothetical protein